MIKKIFSWKTYGQGYQQGIRDTIKVITTLQLAEENFVTNTYGLSMDDVEDLKKVLQGLENHAKNKLIRRLKEC